MPYFLGQPVPLTFPLTDAWGQLVNAAVTPPVVTVTLPDGTTAAPSVSNPGTGIYSATYKTTQAGHHLVAWTCADSAYPGGLEDDFDVRPLGSTDVLQFADALATLSLPAGLAESNPGMASEVREFSSAITSWLEWYCGPIVQQTVTEELKAGGLVIQLSKVPVLDLVAWTAVPAQLQGYPGFVLANANGGPMFPVEVFGVAYPLDQLYVSQSQGWVRHTSALPFYFGPFLWQYAAGYTSIPYGITYAARVLLRHLWGLERGGSGGAGLGASDEEMTPGPMGFMVPNRLIEALAPFGEPAAIA